MNIFCFLKNTKMPLAFSFILPSSAPSLHLLSSTPGRKNNHFFMAPSSCHTCLQPTQSTDSSVSPKNNPKLLGILPSYLCRLAQMQHLGSQFQPEFPCQFPLPANRKNRSLEPYPSALTVQEHPQNPKISHNEAKSS